MKMFIFARDADAVRLISAQSGQQLGWDCDQEQHVDLLVKAVKAELDRTATAMKEALREKSDGEPPALGVDPQAKFALNRGAARNMEHPHNHGWAIYRLEPWRHEGPFPTKREAEAARELRGAGWEVRYAEFGIGNDGLTFRDEPTAEVRSHL